MSFLLYRQLMLQRTTRRTGKTCLATTIPSRTFSNNSYIISESLLSSSLRFSSVNHHHHQQQQQQQNQFTISPNETKTTTGTRLFSSSDSTKGNGNTDTDPSSILQECVDHHDAEQAEELLLTLQKQQHELHSAFLDTASSTNHNNNNTTTPTLDVDTYTSVLDAWISHQQDVLEVMDSPQALVAELYKAADHANGVLDIMLEESSHYNNELVRPTSHHYDAVLKAWWTVCDYNDRYNNRSPPPKKEITTTPNTSFVKDFTKGIPQRAQRVLDQMEYQSNEIHDLQPSIESYNWVMDIWSKSNEHLKASTAQSIYGRLLPLMGTPSPTPAKSKSKPKTRSATATTTNTATNPTTMMMSASTKWGIQPNPTTHRIMLQAWCQSPDEKGAAFHATGHLLKLQEGFAKFDIEDMEPTLEDYHLALKAWSHDTKDKTAHKKAMRILKSMDKLYTDRLTELRPDETCFKYVLQTLANAPPLSSSSSSSSSSSFSESSSVKSTGELADQLLDQMEERFLSPDTDCYGAAIRTWRNHAVMDKKRSRPQEDAARANALLKSMERAYHRTSATHIQPTTQHYNDVIQAWSVCKFASFTVTAGELTEKLLNVLEQGGLEGGDNETNHTDDNDNDSDNDKEERLLKPNTNSYVWTLNAYANSDMDDKVERATAVFDRLQKKAVAEAADAKEEARTVSSDETAQVTTTAANAMMEVCASATTGSDDVKRDRLRTVLSIMADLEQANKKGVEPKTIPSKGGPPNCKSFRILIDACANLLPKGGVERNKALEMAFKKCCNAGLVDVGVLKMFQEHAPRELYHTMVIAESIVEDGTEQKMVPPEWTRNLSHRVLTIDGRRPPPLSIEGQYVMTPALYENRMRKLRKRVNQRLIRGGRLRIPKRKFGRNGDVGNNTLTGDSHNKQTMATDVSSSS